MSGPLVLEFKETLTYSEINFDSVDNTGTGILTYDSPRLTTALPRPNEPRGSDRMLCRTVNGIVKVTFDFGKSGVKRRVIADAALMGAYDGKIGVIQAHSTGPSDLGLEFTGSIRYQNVGTNQDETGLYTQANASANGFGFDYFSSYSNLADEIFIRVIILSLKERPPYANFNMTVSGVLLAADPA